MDQLKLKQTLDRDGYAIVPGVLSGAECITLDAGMWGRFERLAGVQKDDPKTWKNIYTLCPSHGMLFQFFGVGHMQAIWDVRGHPNVAAAFANIYGTSEDELVVSFDGCSFGLQPEVTNRGWHRDDWLHLDQTSTSEFKCVQGWVTALDVEPGDATLTVLKGSHALHHKFVAAFNLKDNKKFRNDWFKLGPEHVAWYKEQGCVQKYIECPKGSLVLWDSRTVHAGRQPLKGRAKPKNRAVCYISMQPQDRLSAKDRDKKVKALLDLRMTTHWAADNVKLFGKRPNTYGKPLPAIPEFDPPHLTARCARLAGFYKPEECPLTIADPEERKKQVAAAQFAMEHRRKRAKYF